ncbi:MAG: hypothetical protein KAI47_13515 [Deltaproteobacteria bacterium]|nr:hypothetical protein [Deltaproteobacteria bacterium]
MIHRHIKAALILVATLTLLAGSASAEPGQAARHRSFMKAATTFLKGATPGARAIFAKRGSRDGLIALGAVLQRTHVSRDLLMKTINNPHAYAKRADGQRALIVPAIKALARLGNISGAEEVLKRSATSYQSEGSTRGALFELVAGSAVKRMGYRLGSLSFQIGQYETDGIVNRDSARPTLVNMKSISSQDALKRVTRKAIDQLKKRNGTIAGRNPSRRNPALLVMGKMPGVDFSKRHWPSVADHSGSDLTVISVNPDTARGRVIFRKGADQRIKHTPRLRQGQRLSTVALRRKLTAKSFGPSMTPQKRAH